MSKRSRMIGTFGAAVVAMCLVGCEKETPKESAPSQPTPTASAPPVATTAPVASAPERKPTRPCPEGSSGKGTFEEPCKATGKSRMMDVTWTKKIDDKGPKFQIVSKAKFDILYGKVVVWFYDKAGKQMNVSGGDKPRRRLTCAGEIFDGAVKPGEKIFMYFSCVKKDDVPKGAVSIEGEIQVVAFTDEAGKNDTYWRNDDIAPEERPKGGIK